MEIILSKDIYDLGRKAGSAAAELIRKAIARNGRANIILATGASQFETLNQLTAEPDIEWSQVVMFHLDEYIGLPVTAKASFRKYLQERFLKKVPSLMATYLINGEGNVEEECKRLDYVISEHNIDVALAGVGENCHLAFNDPPADFNTVKPYIVVNLDENCRKQQLAEGWFGSLEEVPTQAISMSIKQILKSESIICSVPDKRKAMAVRNCLEGPVDNKYPASILQGHPDCRYFLDEASASMLSPNFLKIIA